MVAGNLALDFANTVDDPYGPAHFDHIQNLPRLLPGRGASELLSERQHDELAALAREQPAVVATGLRRAHALRRAVQLVFGAIADGQPVPEQPGVTSAGSIAEAIGHADLTGDHAHVDLVWRNGDLDCGALAGRLRRAQSAHREHAGSGQAVRCLPVAVRRPVQERQPPLVHHGRLR